jgi:hypothetical protein
MRVWERLRVANVKYKIGIIVSRTKKGAKEGGLPSPLSRCLHFGRYTRINGIPEKHHLR